MIPQKRKIRSFIPTLVSLSLATLSAPTAWGQCPKLELAHRLLSCRDSTHSEKLVVLDDKGQEMLDMTFALTGDWVDAHAKSGSVSIRSGYVMENLKEIYPKNRVTLSLTSGEVCTVGEFSTFKVENGLIQVKSFEPVEPSCRPRSGCIVVNGLPKGAQFDFYVNGSKEPVFKNVKTNDDGQVVILGQDAGTYKNIYVKNGGCESIKGEMTLSEPPKPPAPWVKEGRHSGEGNVKLMATGKGTMQWYVGDSLVQTGHTFTTPPLSKTTVYKVLANDDDCVSSPATVTAYIDEPLVAYKLRSEPLSTGSYHVFLENSQKNVVYRLYRDGELVGEQIGTGSKISFGHHNLKGVYQAKAFVFGSAEKIQKGQVTINKQK